MEEIITLNHENIDQEHICCAFSDKKCKTGYELKKNWLKDEFNKGYVFKRLNERAKVFIEYCPSEMAWAPIDAPNYLFIDCFWVSGKYKNNGYGKKLLNLALNDAKTQGKDGLVTIAGKKKFHFMSDTKWLLNQGFEITETLPDGFCILVKKIKQDGANVKFAKEVKDGLVEGHKGILIYYSNRCPFTDYYVETALRESTKKRNIPSKIIKLEDMESARTCPSPATIFSMFYNGKFITTDISSCLDNRFDKFIK